jgi:hypothetical protein
MLDLDAPRASDRESPREDISRPLTDLPVSRLENGIWFGASLALTAAPLEKIFETNKSSIGNKVLAPYGEMTECKAKYCY